MMKGYCGVRNKLNFYCYNFIIGTSC